MKQVALAGTTLLLLGQKAIYWPQHKMLIIADIHFGKATAFRALGVPVPHGTTSDNLARLDALLALHEVAQIVFLGDFLHARTAHAPATLKAMLDWRARHADLRLVVVRGNHDLHAGDPPASLEIEMVDEPYLVAPFALCHHPDFETDADAYVLAGHVHPVVRLSSRRDSLRLPCFLLGAKRAILPSFGAFTGGFLMKPEPGEQVFVAADDLLFAVTG